MKVHDPALDARPEATPFGLGRAIGFSLVLHALIWLVATWTPLFDRVQAATPEESPILRFEFAPPAAPQRPEPQAPRGDTPFPTPPPVPVPAREPARDPTPESAPANPPQQAAPPPAEPARSVPTPKKAAEPQKGAEREQPVPGARLPEDPAADVKPGEEADAARTTPEKTIDLNKALGSFQRSMDQARAARPPAPTGSGTKKNVFTPNDLGPIPMQGAPFGILEFSSRDYDWSDYASQIYWEILRAWYNRLYLTAADFEKWAFSTRSWELAHQSSIRFVIERTGNVSGIELIVPAGCPPLDASALDALSEVILPRLPDDFPRDREEVKATFIATGDIRNMRASLGQLKAMGFF